ncbi:synaptic vesicle glycoprotein 2B-like [Lepisosteus oculatus]|uniref:Synaptic vesicle glycoprotein 2Bb n=1 Tax=Lepisosteus oculatus TaxID=7918 RepID=W5NB41_LEPOC|nr:PREDICTED: synaptic vesicle glycoprotein 2B-like [Lepisosteus oculatus]XP_015198959.1 PREDICTED: synaptic vesicle glycoprotein 2B-like [Lepisosteus oculatus]XP_015198960.1 PREDICTED: synaptic vesicle glycoprotein 2B-like [Lepisosteus oculatus]XP_015198961.1 PREDICTED: synaptic vesicle glycoprotein 2B-like [Lepisosteus oculatus]
MDDPYHSNFYQGPQGGSNTYSTFEEGRADPDGYYRGNEYSAQDEDAASDVTEGHDEDDEVYEGEYQGIPHPDEIKARDRAARAAVQAQEVSDGAVGKMQDEEQLAHQYEAIIEECGHGRFQWTLFFVAGLALMADGVECFVVGFVLPSAEKDMCLSNANKGMLGLIVYLGMMLGAFIWGGLADKMGRKRCLIIALAINSIFAFLSSFVQGYDLFLFFRLFSGIGIGGSIPIVYAYFSEFLSREKRGEHLSWLCMFWMIGGIYASSMAWGIIPHYGWGFSMGTEYHFHSWRVFVLVCALPAIASLIGLTFMPESPRFLLENAKHDEAWMILKQVHDTNMRAKGEPEKVFTVSHIKTPKQDDEFIEIQSSTGTWYQRWMVRIMTVIKQVLQNVLSLFSPQLRLNTLFMAIIWFTMAFSYYGLTVWFPDMIKYLQNEEYESKVKVIRRERVEHFTFNFSLENQIHREGEYFNDKFTKIEMKSVTFEDSLFEECFFEDIRSTDTFFKNCTLINNVFYNTDLNKEKFIDCKMVNTTFLHPKQGCHLDYEEENDVLIYLVSFLGSLAVLPGNIISALFMDKIGRIKMIGGSMLISSVCTFLLFFGSSESAIIGWQCLFCGTSVAAWNGIEVITVELYPTNKRATAFGVLNALCKFAAILGSSIFASFVGITKVIPILMASSALVAGGLLALKLPETREQVLM